MSRLIRSVVIVFALSGSLALLPHLGLPYQPLEVTALRLNPYDTPTFTPTPTATPTSMRTPTPTPTTTPTPRPNLTVNFTRGAPGSSFTLRILGFPSRVPVIITVNGVLVTQSQTSSNGSLTFVLTTNMLPPGNYLVYAFTSVISAAQMSPSGAHPGPNQANAQATTTFTLDPAAPRRQADPSWPTYSVPPRAGFPAWVYLPSITR